ncbi:MAG: dUTP diphosphatase [Desulfobulbaceae bacterium]|nr:dUTP diphosphatase [Candidatus Kapabacteria bacterium]MBS3999144.1 dUTP diphosphatase [Desulfobulbaceae bacterium]
MKIKITRINEKNDLPLPSYATDGSAGMDVYADIYEQITIASQQTVMIPTGLAIELPEGFECQVRSRSGLAAKSGVFALNAPGTIDPDYRGEIKVILSNFSDKEFVVKRGDRIAQLVIAQFVRAEWNLVDDLNNTERGSGGFGSTGIEGRK